jgi:hypothetical protein
MLDYEPLDPSALAENAEHSAEEVRKQDEQAALDWAWLLNDKRGRRIVWGLLSGAGVFKTVFQSGDPHVTSFRDGVRNQGLAVLSRVLKHDPGAFAQMMRENN